MPVPTREAIFAAEDLPRVKVPTPEWGPEAYVWVRTLDGPARAAFELASSKLPKQGDALRLSLRERVAVAVVVDDDGKPLFTEADIGPVGAKSAKVLDRIFDASEELNAMFSAAVEKLEKNSASGPSASSG